MRLSIFILILVLSIANMCFAGPEEWDDRFGIVATDTSGWGTDLVPMQGPEYYAPLRAVWWYNYVSSNIFTKHWPGYNRLFMFWRATMSPSDASIRKIAQDAKSLYPDSTVWYAMSNEPNDRGQANQNATDFAHIYYKYYTNLKAGDPTCKIMGPGLLNWDFHSWSVWQTGRDWYEEFRQAWESNETYRNYSLENYGHPYPPQDGFNLHTYDLRWGQHQAWQYSKDQILMCYADLQTYPETAGKKIWLTEFGDLRAPSRTENAGLSSALVLWMKEQPFIERWFWFINHSDMYGTWRHCELLEADGSLSSLGKAHRDLSLLSPDDIFYHIPYHAEHNSGSSYMRPGWTSAASIVESTSISLRYHLVHGASYSDNTMRGRTYTPNSGKIKKVTFNFTVNYDNEFFHLAMDIPGTQDKWKHDEHGHKIGYAEVDLSDAPADSISFAFVSKGNVIFPHDTGAWWASISNITMYINLPPSTPVVNDFGPFTTSTDSLNASWSADTPSEPISEYWYGVGTTPGGTQVLPWTNTGLDTSATIGGLSLSPGGKYFVPVRVRTSDDQWSEVGISNGISVVEAFATPSDAKDYPNGTLVGMSGVVTANANTLTRTLIVQSPDRSGAIRVWPVDISPTPAIGSTVNVIGTLSERFGERLLENRSVTVTGTADEPIVPLAMSNRSIGGEPLNEITPSIYYGEGLYNMAMLVRTFGRVISVNTYARTFVIDDGGLIPHDIGEGLVVSYSLANGTISPPSVGQYVIVTGISSIRNGTDGKRYPMLRMRSQDDLSTF